MIKAYFNISKLFDDSDVDDGTEFRFLLQTIKVGGVEQLTPEFFIEVDPGWETPASVFPTSGWGFSDCTQSGLFPNSTSIDVCDLGGSFNSWNPFKNSFLVNYSSDVDGFKRGEVTDSISGSVYGLEQFKFGFDKINVPINDAVGGANGSSGASINGAFYLEVDETQDFEMTIQVMRRSQDSGPLIEVKNHTFTLDSTSCSFDYNVVKPYVSKIRVINNTTDLNGDVTANVDVTVDAGLSSEVIEGFSFSQTPPPTPTTNEIVDALILDVNTNSTVFSAYETDVASNVFYLISNVEVLTVSEIVSPIANIQFQNVVQTYSITNAKPLAWLTGGISGWVIPECTQSVPDCESELIKFGSYSAPTNNIYITNAGNGYLYSFPSGFHAGKQFLKIHPATNSLSFFDFNHNCAQQVLANNGNIYAMNRTNTGDRIVKVDPSTDTVTLINIGATPDTNPNNYGEPVAFGQYIYWCPSSNAGDPIMKFDTVLETFITIPTPATGSSGYSGGVLASTDKIYWFPRASFSGSEDILSLDTSGDTVAKIGSVTIFNNSAVVDVSGIIYAFPERGTDIIKLNPVGEVITVIDASVELGPLPDSSYKDAVVGEDLNIYLAPDNTTDTLKFNPSDDSIEFINPNTTVQKYSFGALADNGFIYWLINPDYSEPEPIETNGVLGFDTPNCDEPIVDERICDCIVTQSIGLLAIPPQQPVTLFEDEKQCCYDSLVVGDLSDPVDYKNDINGFLLKRDFPSETISYTLLKNGGSGLGGTDIPLTDDTYGKFYDFGDFTNYPDHKAYQIQWRKVLDEEGEGAYQIKIESNLITGDVVSFSIPFKLRAYTPECVKGTVRIQSIMDGYMRSTDINYKGLEWLDGIRFEGMFGNRQAEYEEERLIFNNRNVKQLRSELLNTYHLKSEHLPSCVTDLILDYHNLANRMLITDYNPINHKTYIQKEVILDAVNDIVYPVVANTAPLDINYKDYKQHYKKSNC